MTTGNNEIVIALYRPHAGKDSELKALVDRHVPTLRKLELITDRPSVLMRSSDGTYVEVFEWRPGAAQAAHAHPAVGEIWEAMGAIADFTTLADLPEAGKRFSHFAPV